MSVGNFGTSKIGHGGGGGGGGGGPVVQRVDLTMVLIAQGTPITIGNGKVSFAVPEDADGFRLTEFTLKNPSGGEGVGGGQTDFQLRNVDNGNVDMLTAAGRRRSAARFPQGESDLQEAPRTGLSRGLPEE